MSKLTRKLQKVFGGLLSPTNEIAAFGSMKANGIATYSTDLDTLQTTQYENGWKAAVVGNNAPFIQDMNGMFYISSKQLAYLFQMGVPERLSTETYYKGSLAQLQSGTDGTGVVFRSLIDSNTSDLTVKASWRLLAQGGYWNAAVTYHTGDTVISDTGKTVYASISDSNLNQAVGTASKWQPIVQNGVTDATGPTTTLDCQTAKVFNVAAGAGGNKTFTIANMYDGQRIDIIVNGANTNTVAFTLTTAAAPGATALTLKSGTGYSGTMTSAVSMFTLTRYGAFVIAQSYHGMA